jgi:ubiquinone/menaquinone biosynthesis C-methylase UbiE
MTVLRTVAVLAVLCGATVAAQHARLFPPENLGLLEGPDRDAYQRPDQIMDALRIGDGSVVADLGAGGGWFTVRLATRVGPNGRVYAEDIQSEMIGAIQRRIKREQLEGRVQTVLGTPTDPKLPPASLDAALMVDAFAEFADPVTLLRNVARALKPSGALKPGGVLGIVNYKKDGGGPGPPIEERVDAEKVIADAQAAGLVLRTRETFLRYQYMLTFGVKPK